MVDVFIEAFIKDFNNQNKIQNTQRANIIDEINTLNKRYQNALLKNADGEMADDDFQEVKKLTKGKIEDLETKLNDLAGVGTEIKDLVASALKKVANIDRRYENGNIEEKRAIIGSMFPDFLEFDGTQHRTARLNSAIALIYQNNNKLQGKKNGTNLLFSDLSQSVNPLVQNSNSFLEDLRRLNQLKDSPYQHDLNVEKNNQPKPKHPKTLQK
ncbi:zinc dependent phospholipase C family protein [Sphingobacterium phlebotomi]|uniref:zinc dependent phospholipase C family protein n=1 Tax=Sphingobacterium phlebotomi TaxID=2605433 RepID=UPI001CA36965|nr:zinc dependent phospholipase C family protein [Sphingobacterium phlebotomi]